MSPRPWALGDYAEVAAELRPAAELLVARCGPVAGRDVLDVGAGDGNVAAAALAAGAGEVTALEPEQGLLAAGRERVPGASWVSGVASALPFPDGSFDGVLSAFGAIFDPDHEATAAELARVCRPGGVVGLTAWIPAGPMAAVAGLLGRGAPPPPPDAGSPVAWGDEGHVRRQLEPRGFSVSVSRETLSFAAASVEARIAREERVTGPWVAARERLGPEGWAEVREEIGVLLAEGNEAGDGSFRITSSYLLVTARR